MIIQGCRDGQEDNGHRMAVDVICAEASLQSRGLILKSNKKTQKADQNV